METMQKSKLITKFDTTGSNMLERSVKKPVKNNSKVDRKITSFHPVPKPGHKPDEPIAVINRVSKKQREREENLQRLNHYLKAKRERGCCVICGSWNIHYHHIIERSVGGKDNAGNLIGACDNCHDHQKYPHGLPISPVEALQLVSNLNRENGISNFLTGDLIPNGGEDGL